MKMLSDLIDFDPNTNKFRVIDEKFSAGVTKMQAIATSDNRVLLIGGVLDSVPMEGSSLRVQTAAKDIQVYDPNSEALYKVAEMLDRRLGFTATAVGRNSVLIFGGSPSWTFNKETKKMDQGKLTTWTEFLVYRPR
jgi:N-acetylneuraminic acid mutarotase